MPPRFVSWSFWLVLLQAAGVRAAPRDAPAARAAEAEPAVASGDVQVAGGLGVTGGSAGGGLASSALLAVRYDWLAGGLFFQRDALLFDGTVSLVAGAFGPVYQAPDGFRLELFGVAGVAAYSGIGCGLFCQGGGISDELPWAGGRLSTSYVFGRRNAAHFELGVALLLGGDLQRKTEYYSTQSTGFLDGTPSSSEQSAVLGGRRSSFELELGGVFDLAGAEPPAAAAAYAAPPAR